MARSLFTVESLESRLFLSTSTLVRLDTNLGLIDVQLTDDVTPNTVANFLNYVNSGRYNNSIFHRDSGNVIQGGGYTSPLAQAIVEDAPVANEFQPGVTTNIRGTIGMAKQSADSATDQFFFNLVDNSSSFDNPFNAGGFTTFGTVTNASLATLDAIAAVPVVPFNPPFDELPLINYAGGSPVAANFVTVRTASVLGVYTDTATIGDGLSSSLSFTDGDGTLTTVSLRGGTGTIHFNGSGVFKTTVRGRTVITGTNVSLDSIAITGATNASLVISGKGGDGVVTVGNITAAGSMAAIIAPTTAFNGTLNVSSYVSRATFGSITGSSLFIGDDLVPSQLRVIGAIADSQITHAGSIALLQAGSWTDSSGTVSSLTTASVGKLVIPGEMAADVTLNSPDIDIASAKLGNVTGGNWFLSGTIVKLAVGSTGPTWAATLGGGIVKMSVGTLQGNLTAEAIASIKAAAITGANINLIKNFDGVVPALAKLSAGSITNTHIRSTDNLGSIATGSFTDSFVSAGINFGDDSIDDITDFGNAATIAAFRSGTFNNSAVIAKNLGKIAIGVTNDAPKTLPFFGVAADKITSFSAVVIDHKLALKLLDDPALVPGLIAAQGVTLNNLQIQVV